MRVVKWVPAVLLAACLAMPVVVSAETAPVLVRDIFPGQGGSYPTSLVAMGDRVFFILDRGHHGGRGTELWKSDGTRAGTVRVKTISSEPYAPVPDLGVAMGGTLYFGVDDGLHGTELWKSDGTDAGTVMVTDLDPGLVGSFPTSVVALGDTFIFGANGGPHGRALWTSDGTAEGTVLVKDIFVDSNDTCYGTGGGFMPKGLTVAGSVAYFSADDGTRGKELWKSDGTEAGTVMVKEIPSGSSRGFLRNFAALGSTLFFTADDGTHGEELWKSDGTEAGTVMVKDLCPGMGNSSYPERTTAWGSALYFRANDGVHGIELWKSDGTERGTTLVKDIRPGLDNGFTGYLVAAGSNLFLTADDGTHGKELWKSDGTEAGTVMVKDILKGSYPGTGNSSAPAWILPVGSAVYFTATDGTHGEELWRSDGTEAGTVMVADIFPGPGGSRPEAKAVAGSTLFFRAIDRTFGSELWSYELDSARGSAQGARAGRKR